MAPASRPFRAHPDKMAETSLPDVAGSDGADAAFSLGLLAELAVTTDSMD